MRKWVFPWDQCPRGVYRCPIDARHMAIEATRSSSPVPLPAFLATHAVLLGLYAHFTMPRVQRDGWPEWSRTASKSREALWSSRLENIVKPRVCWIHTNQCPLELWDAAAFTFDIASSQINEAITHQHLPNSSSSAPRSQHDLPYSVPPHRVCVLSPRSIGQHAVG